MRHPECVEDLSRSLWYRGWSEDMDIAKDVSLAMMGRRHGCQMAIARFLDWPFGLEGLWLS